MDAVGVVVGEREELAVQLDGVAGVVGEPDLVLLQRVDAPQRQAAELDVVEVRRGEVGEVLFVAVDPVAPVAVPQVSGRGFRDVGPSRSAQ